MVMIINHGEVMMANVGGEVMKVNGEVIMNVVFFQSLFGTKC